ncbi:hypothetical protein [Vogesella sp. XCS3]|uniref:hypothetical protein n=1 Tax=Vogesella sp. XCS3 TaxID=2877939 RepID=UPI001D0A05B7|nr:hypothetical protein [Vogesella sp. XCS3]UDM18901.1 hypothetical protein LCH97_18705 [Vogesella sp. XCS3]
MSTLIQLTFADFMSQVKVMLEHQPSGAVADFQDGCCACMKEGMVVGYYKEDPESKFDFDSSAWEPDLAEAMANWLQYPVMLSSDGLPLFTDESAELFENLWQRMRPSHRSACDFAEPTAEFYRWYEHGGRPRQKPLTAEQLEEYLITSQVNPTTDRCGALTNEEEKWYNLILQLSTSGDVQSQSRKLQIKIDMSI